MTSMDNMILILCNLIFFPSTSFYFLLNHVLLPIPFDMAGYIGTSINDGPGCLMLRCPDPSCDAAVDQDMINLLASDEDREKYDRYLLRSYIEDNKKVGCRDSTKTFC